MLAFVLLEPSAGKLACSVPRGLGAGNRAWLPGLEKCHRAPDCSATSRNEAHNANFCGGQVAVSAFLVLLAVLMMRWNVVIGGQEIAKTGKGLLAYHPMLFGREGMLAAAFVVATPFLLLSIMVRLFPPWPQEPKPA
jgi:hypothetical protein